MKDLTKEIETLRDEINSVSVDFSKVLSEISQIEAEKTKAKADYQIAFDDGREDRMSQCLAIVRESSQEIESLKSQLADYPGKVAELRQEQKELVQAARAERPVCEAALKKAQDDMKSVEEQIDYAGGILGEINRLDNLVSKNTQLIKSPKPNGRLLTEKIHDPGNI
jgi:chromosome segregation ATPase